MTLDELQREAAKLDADEQRKLAGFLTVLRMKQSGEWQAAGQAAEAAEDWIPLEEARRRLLRPN